MPPFEFRLNADSNFSSLDCRGPRATSLDNLPRIDQRYEVEPDNIYLQLDSIVVVNHGAHYRVFNFAVVQVDAYFVADVEFALWCLGHGRKSTREARLHATTADADPDRSSSAASGLRARRDGARVPVASARG